MPFFPAAEEDGAVSEGHEHDADAQDVPRDEDGLRVVPEGYDPQQVHELLAGYKEQMDRLEQVLGSVQAALGVTGEEQASVSPGEQIDPPDAQALQLAADYRPSTMRFDPGPISSRVAPGAPLPVRPRSRNTGLLTRMALEGAFIVLVILALAVLQEPARVILLGAIGAWLGVILVVEVLLARLARAGRARGRGGRGARRPPGRTSSRCGFRIRPPPAAWAAAARAGAGRRRHRPRRRLGRPAGGAHRRARPRGLRARRGPVARRALFWRTRSRRTSRSTRPGRWSPPRRRSTLAEVEEAEAAARAEAEANGRTGLAAEPAQSARSRRSPCRACAGRRSRGGPRARLEVEAGAADETRRRARAGGGARVRRAVGSTPEPDGLSPKPSRMPAPSTTATAQAGAPRHRAGAGARSPTAAEPEAVRGSSPEDVGWDALEAAVDAGESDEPEQLALAPEDTADDPDVPTEEDATPSQADGPRRRPDPRRARSGPTLASTGPRRRSRPTAGSRSSSRSRSPRRPRRVAGPSAVARPSPPPGAASSPRRTPSSRAAPSRSRRC